MLDEGFVYSLDTGVSIKAMKQGSYDISKYDFLPLKNRLQKNNISARVVGKDAHFKFDTIVSSPYILYTQGDISLLDQKLLAIVGPRLPSLYQEKVVKDVFDIMRDYQVVTISGGADGIDTLCHELSMHHNIPTIIVLGAGFQYYLSSKYRYLLEQVVQSGGLIISEFRLGEKPAHWTYPQRNRIIAGLSDLVFLPGAGKKSGSLITVDFALKMHKKILAAPAGIFEPQSEGSNEYISTGKIRSISGLQDILDEEFIQKDDKKLPTPVELNTQEKCIYEYLQQSGTSGLPGICAACKIDVGDIFVPLMELQMHGLVDENEKGEWYVDRVGEY